MSDQIPQLPVPSAEDAKKFKSSATSGGGTGGLNLPVPSASEIQKFKSTSAQKKNPIPTGGPSPSVVTKPSSVSNQPAKPTPSASSLAAPKPVSVIPGKSQGKLLMAQPKNTLGENALAIESQKRDVFSPSFGSVNVNKPRAAKAPQAPQAPQVPAPKKVGALEDIGNTFMSSVNRFAGGIVGIPNMSQKSALMMATKMHGIDDEYNSLSVTAKKELDNIMSATSTGAIPNANISREAQDYFIKKSNEFLDKTNKSDKFLNERIGDFFKAPSVEKATDLFLEIPKGFAESLPYMINPVLGAVSAASEQYNKDVQEAGGKLGWGQLVNAGVTGVSEYFIERISNGILNRSVAQAIGAPKVAKELAKGFVKSVLKDVGMEGAGEGLTEFVQSLSDDITKGKEINWVETANRTLDASIKGSGVAGGMRTTGAGVGYLAKKVMPKSDKNKVDRNTRAIMDLNTKKGPDNSPEVNSVIDSKIKELNDENKNIINSNIAKAKSLSDSQIQEVVKIDSDIQAIKNNRDAIVADPNLTDAEKQSLLDHLKSQAATLTERKTAVQNQQPLTEASFGQPDELGRITFEFGSEKEIPSELKGLTPTGTGSSTDEKGNRKIFLSFSEEQLKPIRDAIQKQTTSEVPVQPEAGTSLQVAEGEPQAEPQVPTQEGQGEEVITTKKISRQERKRANEIVDILDKAYESEQDKTLTGVKYNDIFIGDESLGDILNENKLSLDEKRTIKEVFRRNIGYFNFDKSDEQKFLEGSANPEDAQDVYEALSMLPIVESSQYSNYNKQNYDNVKDEIDYIVSNPEKYTPNVVGVITKIKDKLDNPKSPSTRLYAVDVNKMLGVQPAEDKNKLSKEEKDSLIKELESITKTKKENIQSKQPVAQVAAEEGQGQEVAPTTQPTTEQPMAKGNADKFIEKIYDIQKDKINKGEYNIFGKATKKDFWDGTEMGLLAIEKFKELEESLEKKYGYNVLSNLSPLDLIENTDRKIIFNDKGNPIAIVKLVSESSDTFYDTPSYEKDLKERYGPYVVLDNIYSLETGGGKEAINEIKKISDENGVNIILRASGIESPKTGKLMTPVKKLKDFYKNLGFENVEFIDPRDNDVFIYKAQGQKEAYPTQPSTEQPTTEQPVEEPKQIKVADAESIEKQMQTTFGLNKTQSKAAAVVIDKIAGTMAKRAGTTKSKIMDAIAFKKGDINELSDQALFQKAERIKASKEDVDNAIKEVRSMGEKSPLGNETFMPNGTGVEIRNWEGSLWISSIYTLPEVRGKGAATETMIDILNIASKYNVPVRLEASPFGAQKGLTKNQLINWYKKLGFKNIGFGELQKAPSTISQEVLKEGKEIKIEPVVKVKATEKRKMPEGAKLVKPEYFFLDGEYDVVVNGKTIGNIYYDRASRTWNDPHFDRTQETPWSFKWMYGEILGENKEEAVTELIKRYKQFPEGVKFQKSNNIAKGAMQLASDGSAIIYALTDPDVSTPLHEMAHVYENYLTEDERKSVLDWAGKKDWDMPVSEKFARGFEKYLAEGKAPSKELTKIFDSFKKWLLDIYNGIVGSEIDIKLNDDMRKIYDTMLTEGEEVGIKELPGYARMMGEVDGIIEKSMNRGVPFNKTMDNAINYMEKSKVYEDATDTQREAMVREVRKMFDKKEKKAPTAKKILGEKPTKTTITVDESKELNKRLKALESAEETGRKIGYKEGLKESEQARKGILDYVKSLKVNNKISGSQFKAIVNALKANLLNPVIRKRVEERIDKIIKKANYADQLERSNKLRAAIKKASKSKTLAANIAIMAKKFAKVNPNNVENLDEYIDMANLVYNSIGKPMRTIAEEAMVNEYSEMKIKEAQEAKSAGLEDLFNSLVKQGLIPKNLSLAEIQQYVLEEEQNKKVEESEQREKEKRDVLDIVFNGLKDISNVMLNDGYNPFTGEDVTLSTEDRQLLKDFTSMDLSKLPISSGYRAQEALMNYIVNGRKFGMRGILARYQGAENVKVAVKKGLKAADFRWAVGGSWWGSRKWAKEVESIPGLFTWLFRGRTRGREVMKLMGLDEFMAGAAEAKIDRVSAENEYIAKFLNKKPNGKRFNNINNTYERLVYAYLSRSVDGSAEEKQAEFDRRKRILAQNVQAMEQSRNKDLIEEAQVLKRELNKAKDAKNADELNSKFDTINIQAVEFISGKFDEYFDKVDEVAEGIYNLILSKDDLYTPDMFRDISEKEINVAEMKESVDIPFDLLNKKPVGTMLENKRIPNLPGYDVKNNDASKVTKILKLDFDSSAFNALEKSLTDTYTAEAVQKYSAFVKSDEFYKLFDNVNDEKLFKEIVNYYINNERGKVGYKSDWKAVQNFSTRLKNFSTYRALGSATAFLKQSASAMINTSINLSNDPYALSQVTKAMLKDEAIGDFINRSRSEINLRGAEATADIKSAEKLIRESKYQGLTDALDTIDKLGRFQMKSLSFGDVPMARASWFGYYVHALKIQGKPYKNIDWSKAKLDKDAATYANTEVSINQNASMPSTLGQLFSSKNPLTRLTATYLFPFTSFLFNAKSRLKTDITVLTSKLSTPEDKQAAGRSIVATLAEMPAYIAISTSINYALVGAANAFLGYDEDEEDEKLRLKRYSELAVTRIITDLLSPAPNVGDVATVAAFNALLEKMQEDPDMEEEEKKDVFKLFESKPESMLSAMAELLLQPISSTGRRTMDIYNTIDMAVGDVYVTDSGKEIEFLDEEKKMLKIAAAIQIMGSLNLLPSEAESLAKKMVKTIEKSAKEDVN